jgi:hypothetical protein
VTEAEMGALLDAHDALVRACVDSSLTFEEFVAAYGDFPGGYAPAEDAGSAEERSVLRRFRKRIAFHRLVSRVIAGARAPGEAGISDSELGCFLLRVGSTRLRELVGRYPEFEAGAA